MSEGPKVLHYDIETLPKVGVYWGPEWQTRIAKRVKDWELLSVSWRFENDKAKTPKFEAAWEGSDWEDGLLVKHDRDYDLCETLWNLYDEADVVVAHNGDKFDQQKANARFLRHGMGPPSHYVEVDTIKIARTFFALTSYSLAYLADYLGVEHKLDAGGIDTWENCVNGDKTARAHMKKYNIQDVKVLADVYAKLEPWIGFNGRGRKFNRALWDTPGELVCPNCGGYDLVANGFRETQTQRYQSYLCNECGGRPSERTIAITKSGVVLK